MWLYKPPKCIARQASSESDACCGNQQPDIITGGILFQALANLRSGVGGVKQAELPYYYGGGTRCTVHKSCALILGGLGACS